MNPRRPRPPRSAERLLGLLLPWRYREEHLGDLEEGFGRRSSAGASANRWCAPPQSLSRPPASVSRIGISSPVFSTTGK